MMKRCAGLCLVAMLAMSASAQDGSDQVYPVVFSNKSFTNAPMNKRITVTPMPGTLLQTDGTNVWTGVSIILQPVGGRAQVNLYPGFYNCTIEGIAKSFTIEVYPTNGVQYAAAISTNLSAAVTFPFVQQLVAGPGISLSPTNGRGVVTITATNTGGVSLGQLTTTSNALQASITGTSNAIVDQVTVATNDLANALSDRITGNTDFATAVSNSLAGVDANMQAQIDALFSPTNGVTPPQVTNIVDAFVTPVFATKAELQGGTNWVQTNLVDRITAASNTLAQAVAATYQPLLTTLTDLGVRDGYLRDLFGNSFWSTNSGGRFGWIGRPFFSSPATNRVRLTDAGGTNLATLEAKVDSSNVVGLVQGEVTLDGTNQFTGPNTFSGSFSVTPSDSANAAEFYDRPGGNIIGAVKTNGQAAFNLASSTNLPQASVVGLLQALAYLTNNGGGSNAGWTLQIMDGYGIGFLVDSNTMTLIPTNTGPAVSITNVPGWGVAWYEVLPRLWAASNSAPSITTNGGADYVAEPNFSSVMVTNTTGSYGWTSGAMLQSTNIGRIVFLNDSTLIQLLAARFTGAVSGTNIDAGTIDSTKIAPDLDTIYRSSTNAIPTWALAFTNGITGWTNTNGVLFIGTTGSTNSNTFSGVLAAPLIFLGTTNDIINARDIYALRDVYGDRGLFDVVSLTNVHLTGLAGGTLRVTAGALSNNAGGIQFGAAHPTNVSILTPGDGSFWFRKADGSGYATLRGDGSLLFNVSASRVSDGAYLGSSDSYRITNTSDGIGINGVVEAPLFRGSFQGDGTSLTIDADYISTGTVPIGRLGSVFGGGAPDEDYLLFGDNVWRPSPYATAQTPTFTGLLTHGLFSGQPIGSTYYMRLGAQELVFDDTAGVIRSTGPISAAAVTSSGFITASNAFSSASTVLPMGQSLTCVASGAISLASISGWRAGGENSTTLTVIPNGADRTLFFAQPIRTQTGQRSLLVTNNTVCTLVVWGMPGVFTNASWQFHW